MNLNIHKSGLENELIRKCKRQDAKAQHELYSKYAAVMLGLCRRYVKEIQEAEDVMIKGFMKVFGKIETFEGSGSFEGWMKRIMIHESLSYLRRNKSMYLETEIEEVDKEPDFDRLSHNLEVQDLMDMIDELPSGYKTIFNLYAIEGYSHREIAELLEISVNTSKSQLSRARMHLQKKLLLAEQLLEKKKFDQDGK